MGHEKKKRNNTEELVILSTTLNLATFMEQHFSQLIIEHTLFLSGCRMSTKLNYVGLYNNINTFKSNESIFKMLSEYNKIKETLIILS